MRNAETQHMIDLVERQTGYRVTVDVISSIYEHAQMISARPKAPAHIIRVNADRANTPITSSPFSAGCFWFCGRTRQRFLGWRLKSRNAMTWLASGMSQK